MILVGLVALLYNIMPKYLNSSTVSIFYIFTYTYALQFINMALVLPTFICNEFLQQKVCTRLSNSYNSLGEGASSTKSSAYASINNYKEAIV
jgi:hypothetical protein